MDTERVRLKTSGHFSPSENFKFICLKQIYKAILGVETDRPTLVKVAIIFSSGWYWGWSINLPLAPLWLKKDCRTCDRSDAWRKGVDYLRILFVMWSRLSRRRTLVLLSVCLIARCETTEGKPRIESRRLRFRFHSQTTSPPTTSCHVLMLVQYAYWCGWRSSNSVRSPLTVYTLFTVTWEVVYSLWNLAHPP